MITYDKIKIEKRVHSEKNRDIPPGDTELLAYISTKRSAYVQKDNAKDISKIEDLLKSFLIDDAYGELMIRLRELKFTCMMHCKITEHDEIRRGFDAVFDLVYANPKNKS